MAVDVTSDSLSLHGNLDFLSFDLLDDDSRISCIPSETSDESSHSYKTLDLPDPSLLETNTLMPAVTTSQQPLQAPKQRGTPLKFPPCVICGGKASGLHYGCNTCEACKNFFRRYIIKQNVYICSKKNNCDISFMNKSNCSACRVAKCLGLGMSKTKSRLGRYTYNRRTETIKEVKKLEGKACEVSQVQCPSKLLSQGKNVVSAIEFHRHLQTFSTEPTKCPELQHSFSSSNEDSTEQKSAIDRDQDFDENFIQTLAKAVGNINLYRDDELQKEEVVEARCKEHYEKFHQKMKMFGSMNAVSREEYQVLLKDFGIDIDNALTNCKIANQSWESIFDRYSDFAKSLPGFNELSENDQSSLLKMSHCAVFAILMHKCYRAKYNVLIDADCKAYHLEEYSDKFMSRAYMDKICKFYEHLQKLKLTKEEITLLVSVCLFSTDSCQLEHYDQVENLQAKYFNLLSQHLHAKYENTNAVNRLAKLLDCLIKLRDVSDMYFQEMTALNDDKTMKEFFPLLEKIIPDTHCKSQ